MFEIAISLALLGLSAIDPIGIGAMPVLLLQKKPFQRATIFLSGSFVSLLVMGLIFAHGFGAIVLHFQNAHPWIVPAAEAVAGSVLLVIAAVMWWRMQHHDLLSEPSKPFLKELKLSNFKLFLLGASLVAVQSVVDVVFVIAMIHLGQLSLSTLPLTLLVIVYAFAALLLQILVVVVFRFTPSERRAQLLGKIHVLLTGYANQAIIITSAILGFVLIGASFAQ